MRIALRTGMLALAVLALAAGQASAGEVSAKADATKPFLVKIHADWCGTCTKLNATWEALEETVGSEARLVILDVTDKPALEAAQAEADRLGIAAFFAEYKARTGTVAVLRGDDRSKVAAMKGVTDAASYEAPLAEARANPS